MPDDDKFTRDHGPGWTGATRALVRDRPRNELSFGDGDSDPSGGPGAPRLSNHPDTDAAIKRALEGTVKGLGSPDLNAAADNLRTIAQGLSAGTLDPDELCSGPSASGAEALAGQAVRTLAATRNAEDLMAMSSDELTEDLAIEFLRGVGRRYGIDRVAPFDLSDSILDSFDALDLLSGFDMFLLGPLVRGLVGDLLG
ncbi:hypothetical protein [Streptomonospora wellingtoniae]|uniref:Acyl carrier protein n=1 Tax=Streptomonospora wellingtoniae TaxID=3075544 RepID=A0ABU2L0A0_9ACTN|nr:hypothetical protein [Streptomonospora sp. DSM 45055]MDT0304990.1 hypothetical protein [Streptomonospora sp. DSM 45055]